MAYKVFAQDIAAPFSHMVFYTTAQMSDEATQLIGLKSKSPLQEVVDTRVNWCLDDKNTLALEKRILKKLESHQYSQKIVDKSYESLKEFHRAALKIKNKNFNKYTNKQLVKELKLFLKIWVEAATWGHIVNLSDFHFSLLSDKVIAIIKKKIREKDLDIFLSEVFATLTTPTKRSLMIEQELDLFKLLNEIQKNKNLKELFLKNQDLEVQLKKLSFWKKIQDHTHKYDWLQYHYIGPTILAPDYFIEILQGLIKQRVNGQKKIKEIIDREKQTAQKQKQLRNKLQFAKDGLYWIDMVKEFAYLKGWRKEVTFIACCCYDSILKQIAKRLGLSLKQLQFMALQEIYGFLSNKKTISPNLLNQRIKYCVVYYPQGRVQIYTGSRAKKLAQKIQQEKIEKDIKEIKGSAAYPGIVKGEVVIIFSAQDMSKMKKGNVLVSPATNPNIMPAITKAAAIITDEGGITCHAAIVSREFGIPCIIGTKIATKVLKDGDLVEIDADRGIIKKLK